MYRFTVITTLMLILLLPICSENSSRADYFYANEISSRAFLNHFRRRPKRSWEAYPIACEGIYLLDPEDKFRCDLRGDEPFVYCPSWSPSRSLIAYSAGTWYYSGSLPDGIYIMNADGTNKRRVTIGMDFQPAWSPDEKRLAFVRSSPTDPQEHSWLCVLNIATHKIRILYSGDCDIRNPSWSPSGKTIAFASNHSGKWKIWLVNANGRVPRILPHQPSGDCVYPNWSQKRNLILFGCTRGSTHVFPMELYTVRPSGSDLHQLPIKNVMCDRVSWSPGGDKILYLKYGPRWMVIRGKKIPSSVGTVVLYVSNPDGSHQHQIIPRLGGTKSISSPDW